MVHTAPGKRGHGPSSKAWRAALTAKSTSSLSPSAILANTSPVLGSMVSNVFPILILGFGNLTQNLGHEKKNILIKMLVLP